MSGHVRMGTFGMDGEMRDTRMSDSPSTAVAMRVNSQHQSDKLPDKVVRPWRCHDDGHNKQTLSRFDKTDQALPAC